MISDLNYPHVFDGLEIRELVRDDLDIISSWPKYEYPFAWANFNIVNNMLKDKWMVKNKRLDTLWFVIIENGEIISRGSLINPEENDELIFGIVLRKDLIGQGTGTRCVRAVMDMVFSSEKYQSVWLETKEDNNRARRTWEKVGFLPTCLHYRRDSYGNFSRFMGYRLYRYDFIKQSLST